MFLLNKSIDEITYDDVEKFCKKEILEGVYLDYKKDFSSKEDSLAKTIASFANTEGGVIIIGVGDNKGRPKLPIIGVKNYTEVRSRVASIIIDNIFPIVMVEEKVCLSKDKSKAVVVIRVPQSNSAPHAISNRSEIYVRVKDRKKLEEIEKFADLEQIEWLMEKRKKSEELKTTLINEAKHRHNKELETEDDEDKLMLNGSYTRTIPFGHGYFYVVPLYPYKALSNPDKIKDFSEEELCVNDYCNVESKFPGLYENRKVARDAVVVKENNESYTELNEFGMFYHGEGLMKPLNELKNNSLVDVDNLCNGLKFEYCELRYILRRLNNELEIAFNFLKKLRYWGYVEVYFELDDLYLSYLCYSDNDEDLTEEGLKESLDYKFVWKKVVLVQALKDEKMSLLEDFCKKFGWCFGWQLADRFKDGFIEDCLGSKVKFKV